MRIPFHLEKDSRQGTVINGRRCTGQKVHRPEETQLGGPEFYAITLNWYASMTDNSPLHGSALRNSYRPSTQATVDPEDCNLIGSKLQLTGIK